jgi:membrane-associated PAP2 superfamily phosphatase
MSEMTARKSRRFFLNWDFLIPVFLFIITIIVFRDTGLDLRFQNRYFDPDSGWFLKELPVFKFVYHYGNLPALLLAIGGLFLFGLSFQAYKWAKWRKIGIFLAAVMLIGPGLLINSVLKDNWGRPRPRNVTDFGGKYTYEKVLSIDSASPGKSFPCGHASMGFYLFIPWFVLRKKHKVWASVSLVTGILYGLLIGIARIAQGGHWLSDVIIAGLLVYLTGTLFYYLFRLDKALWFYPKHLEIDRRQRTIVALIVSVFTVFLLLGVGLATPYSHKSRAGLEHRQSINFTTLQPARRHQLELKLQTADLILAPGKGLRIEAAAQGFGFPGSRIIPAYWEGFSADTLKMFYSQKQKRFFTELDNSVFVAWNYHWKGALSLSLHKGSARLIVPEYVDSLTLNVSLEKGDLDLDLPASFKPRISLKGDFVLADSTGFTSSDSVYVREDFRVNLIVRKGKITLR